MTDIVERMRLIDPTLELRHEEDVTRLHEIGLWCDEAADEIERLREALSEYTCDCENGCQGIRGEVCGSKARAALEEKE